MTGEIFSTESFLWSCLWQSTIFLVAGLLGSFLLRRHSARAHRVLFLAMIAAVIVPAVSLLVKHYELGLFIAEPAVIKPPTENRAIYEATGIISNESTEFSPAPINQDMHPPMTSSEAAKFPWRSALLYVWIAASLILAARLLVTFVLGARLLGRAMPLNSDKIEQAIHPAKAKLGISRDVKVYGSENIHSPVIWCWKRRPVLLVPSRVGQFDNKIDWTGVLCHELAHYKRRDHVAGLLAELMVCILPWHPLLWWAKSRLISLSEQACDDWVVATGQQSTDYAESLLNLTPGGQMAFVPAVVRSKKGLADRIHRILQENCVNPQAGVIWALTVSIVAVCLTVGIAFAQTRPSKTEGQNAEEIQSSRRRVISFPEDRSMGKLFARDSGQDSWYEGWQELGEAKGDVSVAAGKEVKLQISEQAAGDLTALDKLGPDDLQMLSFGWKAMKVGSLGPISNLKGMKALNIQSARFDSEDFKYLTGLAQLEVLRCGDHKLTDTSMRYVGQLTSLRSLALWGTGISDEGLKHLQGLTNLTFLALNRCEITDQGLEYLRNMTALEGLQIYQTKITDNGLEKLRGFTRLKHVKLDDNGITDAGLKHIENLTSLENIWINSNPITDKGLSYLAGMKNLKQLYALNTKITDAGLANFKGAKDIRLVVGQIADRVTAGEIESSRRRVNSFPEDRSMGKLFAGDSGQDIEETKTASAEGAQDSAVNEGKVKLCLFDKSGKPVVGAKVGTSVNTREAAFLGSRLSWHLSGNENNVSNERGEIELTRKNFFPDWWPPERKAALYVLHEERKIGATCEISKDDLRGEIPLTLVPVCHVHGRLGSEALKKIGRPLNLTNVYLKWNQDSHGVLSHTSHNSKEYRFDFLVPPGQYELYAYGYGEGTSTEKAKPKVDVKAGQTELDMGVIDLPPTKLALLIGKPAPELGPIKAWKNGSPVKLAELRGKPVILHFGGEYPSTSRDLPRLTELHEEFSEAGLVIVGLYNCESMQQLEERLSGLSKEHGGEPGVPFRLAIDGGKGRIVEGTDWQVPGETYAAYDIKEYTTTILIDQEGKILERLNLNRAREKLQSLLGIPAETELPAWKQRFEQVYRLDEDRILKRIAPPFIPERKEYFANERPSQAERNPEGPALMIFHWRDNKENLSYTLDYPNFSLSKLVQYIFKIGTPDMWWGDTGNYSGNPDGPEQLLGMKLPGDWIIRNEAPPQAMAQALEKLIADEFGRNITIRNSIEQRDVIVATGQFKFSPVYSDEEIVMFADEDESVRKKGETVLSGTNTIAQFLQQLEWLVSVPVIDRTKVAEDTHIEYRAHLSNPSIRRIKNISEKKDKLRFFLDTLSKQTNLQFEITREPIEVWFVTEDTEN